MAAELRVLSNDWRVEEARIERQAGLAEFADDAEEAYALLRDIPRGQLSRKVIDYRFHRALHLIARAGSRARLAEAEMRDLGGDAA